MKKQIAIYFNELFTCTYANIEKRLLTSVITTRLNRMQNIQIQLRKLDLNENMRIKPFLESLCRYVIAT